MIYREFEDLLGSLLVKLNDCLQTGVNTNKSAYFLQAKNSLIELCLLKIGCLLRL